MSSEVNSEANGSDRSPIEDHLVQAMGAQAERVEPLSGSYERLEAALKYQSRPSKRSRLGRPIAIAAASLAVVGLGAFAVSQQPRTEVATSSGGGQTISPTDDGASGDQQGNTEDQPGDVDRGESAENSSSGASQQQNQADPSTEIDDSSASSEGGPEERANVDAPSEDQLQAEIAAQQFAPVGSSRSSAVRSYLHLIDGNRSEFDAKINDLPTGPDQDPVVVPITSGEVVIAELIVAEIDDGFTVIGHSPNDDLAIDDIDTSRAADGIVTITGAGSGFEGSAYVEFFSVGDGRLLASATVPVGSFDEPKSFTVDVPVIGYEQAVVVLRSLTPVEFDPEFVAATVTYDGPDDNSDYVVVRVAADDPDGGLVMRQGPGTQFERVAVIEPGSSPVARLHDFAPYLVDSEVWWNVVNSDGTEGWVNSAFLARRSTPTARQLATADDVLIQIRDDSYESIPFARRVAVGSFSSPQQISGQELVSSQRWTEPRRLPEGDEVLFEGSLEQFFNVEESTLFEIESDESASPELQNYFGGLASQVAEIRRLDQSVHRVHVFYEPTPGGIQVIGLISEPIS